MENILINQNNWLKFRLTPWDEKVVKLSSNEVLEITYSSEEQLNLLLEKLEEYCLRKKIRYTIIRVSAGDKILRRKLQTNNYYFAESSLKIAKNDIQKTDFVGKRKLVTLTEMKEKHLSAIKKISYEDFHYGRLIEDPFLEEYMGRQRSANWIDDLWNQENEKFVWEKNNEVIGFHFQKVFADEERSELILSGVREKESMMSVFFWASFLEMLKHRGIKRTDTLISTANLGVLNLYIYFQFKVKETLFGFHKLRK